MKNFNPKLTKEQIAILRDKGTEPAFSGKYLTKNESGFYQCANCSADIFDSKYKYNSGSGWPSFDRALTGSVKKIIDNSHGMHRTEVVCAKCGGHLGHVFSDGPEETTGLRYCINSLALGFQTKKTQD